VLLWGGVALFAEKKNETFGLCLDFRELTKIFIKKQLPFILNDHLFDQLQTTRVLSKIYLRYGYFWL